MRRMKRISLLILSAAMTIGIGTVSYAGQWQSNSTGWWWQEDDGTWPVSEWKEINGKYYYFGADGYMLANTTTPDGYYVDASGAWVQNGEQSTSGITTTAASSNTEYPTPDQAIAVYGTAGTTWDLKFADDYHRTATVNGQQLKNQWLCWVSGNEKTYYFFEESGLTASDKWIGNYYVNTYGIMLRNSITPDGRWVGDDGAWVPDKEIPFFNDGVHTKSMSDPDVNMDMNINILEYRTDVNGNPYVLVSEDTTTFSFNSALSNVNPQNLNVSMAVYRYSPETNTIYAFSQDGTAIYLPFEYDKVYNIQITNTNLTGRELVEYCKNNNLAIAINAFDITTNNARGFIICYE